MWWKRVSSPKLVIEICFGLNVMLQVPLSLFLKLFIVFITVNLHFFYFASHRSVSFALFLSFSSLSPFFFLLISHFSFLSLSPSIFSFSCSLPLKNHHQKFVFTIHYLHYLTPVPMTLECFHSYNNSTGFVRK